MSVHVRGVGAEQGMSADDFAGYLAAQGACGTARDESKRYVALGTFDQRAVGSTVVSERGTTTYHGGTDGRPVGATTTPDQYGTRLLGQADLDAEMLTVATALDPDGVRNRAQIRATIDCSVVTFEPLPVPSGTGTFMNTGNGSFGIHVDGPPGSTDADAGLIAKRAACEVALASGDPYLIVEHFTMGTRDGHGRALFVMRPGDEQIKAMFERLSSVIDAQTCDVLNPDIDPMRSE